jgi:hypothetical protein
MLFFAGGPSSTIITRGRPPLKEKCCFAVRLFPSKILFIFVYKILFFMKNIHLPLLFSKKEEDFAFRRKITHANTLKYKIIKSLHSTAVLRRQ